MTRSRRWRIALWCLGGLVALFVVLVVGVRIYLATPQAARMASQKLSDAFGAPVQVDSLSAGFRTSGVRGLKIFEPGTPAGAQPWLTAASVDTDLPVWSLAAGGEPHAVTIRGASATIRLDAKGQLLTKLPAGKGGGGAGGGEPMPTIRLEDSRLTIEQEGIPPAEFHHVNAELRSENGQLVLGGGLDDPAWGSWSLDGHLNPSARSGSAHLRTKGEVAVNQEILAHVPFAGPEVWNEIRINRGTVTLADVVFAFDGQRDYRHFRVQVDLRNTDLDVPSIELPGHDASGEVVIEDGVVTLKNVDAKTADGSLRVDATLDFRKFPRDMHYVVRAKGLDVWKLPAEWHLPKGIEGHLNGNADVTLLVHADGKFQTRGEGKGVIPDAKLEGFKAEPIEIFLRPAGSRFEFGQGGGAAKPNPPAPFPKREGGVQTSFLPGASKVSPALPNLEHPPSFPGKGGGGVRFFRRQPALLLALASSLQAPEKPAPKDKKGGGYIQINLGLKDVDLAELLKRMEVKLPFRVAGKLTFHVSAGIPTDTPNDLSTYRATGTASMPRLTVEDLQIDQVQTRVVYRNGTLRLDEFSGRIADPTEPKAAGGFKGTASLGVIPSGDLSAKLTLNDLPLAALMRVAPSLAGKSGGVVSGEAEFKAPAGQLRDPAAWHATARLASKSARALGWEFRNFEADARLDKGTLNLSPLKAEVQGFSVNGAAKLQLRDKYPFRGRLELGKVDLSALNKLVPAARPPVRLAGTFTTTADLSGTLNPLSYQVGGTADAEGLTVEDFRFDKLDFRWAVDPDRLRLSDLQARLFGGQVTGSGVIPFRNDVAGEASVQIKSLNFSELTKQLLATAKLRVQGTADGIITATMPAVKEGQARPVNAQVELTAPKLSVQNIPAEKLKGTATYQNGEIAYKLTGETLGGQFDLEGQYPPRPSAPAAPAEGKQPAPRLQPKDKQPEEPNHGRLRLTNARLSRLWTALGMQRSLGPLDATVSLDLPFRIGPEGWPVGTGTLRLDRVRWNEREVAQRLTSTVRLEPRELRINNLNAAFGQGIVRGGVTIDLARTDRSRVFLVLENVRADRLLFAVPGLTNQVEGTITARIRSTLGQELRGDAVITAARLRVAGLDVVDLRLPIDWAVYPGYDAGEVHVRDMHAVVAAGRVLGSADYEFLGGGGSRLDGGVRFTNMNVAALAHSTSDLSVVGVGQATGRFDFAGRDVRSLNDLTGTLESTLGQTEAFQLPVLRDIVPYLGPGRMMTRTTQRSELRARLANGVWNVQRLALVGRNLQVFAYGTVTMAGRLNLQVVANTGTTSVNPNMLALFGLRIPVMVGPIPLGLIMDVSRYLSDRTVQLEVTGTIRSPVIRVKVIPMLTEEAVRFFLNKSNLPISY